MRSSYTADGSPTAARAARSAREPPGRSALRRPGPAHALDLPHGVRGRFDYSDGPLTGLAYTRGGKRSPPSARRTTRPGGSAVSAETSRRPALPREQARRASTRAHQAGRQTSGTAPGTCSRTRTHRYTWDARGRLVAVDRARGTDHFRLRRARSTYQRHHCGQDRPLRLRRRRRRPVRRLRRHAARRTSAVPTAPRWPARPRQRHDDVPPRRPRQRRRSGRRGRDGTPLLLRPVRGSRDSPARRRARASAACSRTRRASCRWARASTTRRPVASSRATAGGSRAGTPTSTATPWARPTVYTDPSGHASECVGIALGWAMSVLGPGGGWDDFDALEDQAQSGQISQDEWTVRRRPDLARHLVRLRRRRQRLRHQRRRHQRRRPAPAGFQQGRGPCPGQPRRRRRHRCATPPGPGSAAPARCLRSCAGCWSG